MEVPCIVKLNRLKWKKRQRHRTKCIRAELHRTYNLENEKEAKMNRQKSKDRSKTVKNIMKPNRKSKETS